MSNAADEQPAPKRDSFSQLMIDGIQLDNGTVVVDGSTDLPDGAILSVDFSAAGKPNDAYVGASEDAAVRGGKYHAVITPPDHPRIAQGPNEVWVLFTPMADQPDHVLKQVGTHGEHLTGPLAETDHGLTTLNLTQRVALTLGQKSYPMVRAADYRMGSADRAVADYLLAWQAKDFKRMAGLTQLTWRDSVQDPQARLAAWYGAIDLLGAEIMRTERVSDVVVDVVVERTKALGSTVKHETVTCRVIRETAPYQPDSAGAWGVNATSCI